MHLRIIIVSEAFCEGVVVDLELCDLQLNKHQELRSGTNAEVAAGSCCYVSAYVCVLVSRYSDKLVFRESEGLCFSFAANVLNTILCHLHDVQPRLVLVQGLHDDHLFEHTHRDRNRRCLCRVHGQRLQIDEQRCQSHTQDLWDDWKSLHTHIFIFKMCQMHQFFETCTKISHCK